LDRKKGLEEFLPKFEKKLAEAKEQIVDNYRKEQADLNASEIPRNVEGHVGCKENCWYF
jgi:hypothetical protein